MCELLVRVTDKVGTDPYLDAKCLKRADVVVVVADGWNWRPEELTAPFWRILKLPACSVAAGEAFLGAEFDLDPQHPSRVLRRRAFMLDLTSWPNQILQWLADDTRAVPFRTSNISEATLLTLKLPKARLVDPNVL